MNEPIPMSESKRIARFRGGVSCRREDQPLGLTLIGRTTERPDELVSIAFMGVAPTGLPEVLEDVAVEQLEATRFRIWADRREWFVTARSCHVHREISTTFYKAIPPRQPHRNKRLFWRIVLAVVANPVGKRLLLTLRRH